MTTIADIRCQIHKLNHPSDMACPRCASDAPPVAPGESPANVIGVAPAPAPDDVYGLRRIPLDKIIESPWEVRTRRGLERHSIQALADDMYRRGQDSPIIVRPSESRPGYYERASGQRRCEALKLLWGAGKWREDWPFDGGIDAIVRLMNDKDIILTGLGENVQRSDVSPLDQLEGYERILKGGDVNARDLASTIGRSESWLSNFRRLRLLPDKLLDFLESGDLSQSTLRDLVPFARSRGSNCNHSDILDRLVARLAIMAQRNSDESRTRGGQIPRGLVARMLTVEILPVNGWRQQRTLTGRDDGSAYADYWSSPDNKGYIHSVPGGYGNEIWTCDADRLAAWLKARRPPKERQDESEQTAPEVPRKNATCLQCCGNLDVMRRDIGPLIYRCPACQMYYYIEDERVWRTLECEADADKSKQCARWAKMGFLVDLTGDPDFVCLPCYFGDARCSVCKRGDQLLAPDKLIISGDELPPLYCRNCSHLADRVEGDAPSDAKDGENEDAPPSSPRRSMVLCPSPGDEPDRRASATCQHCGSADEITRNLDMDVHWICGMCRVAIRHERPQLNIYHIDCIVQSGGAKTCTGKQQSTLTRQLVALNYLPVHKLTDYYEFAGALTTPAPDVIPCSACWSRNYIAIWERVLERSGAPMMGVGR